MIKPKNFNILLFSSVITCMIFLILALSPFLFPMSIIDLGDLEVEIQGFIEIVFIIFAVIFAILSIILLIFKIYNEYKKAQSQN